MAVSFELSVCLSMMKDEMFNDVSLLGDVIILKEIKKMEEEEILSLLEEVVDLVEITKIVEEVSNKQQTTFQQTNKQNND